MPGGQSDPEHLGSFIPSQVGEAGVHHKNGSPATPGSEIYTCEPKSQNVFSLSHLRQPSSATQAIGSELGSGIHLPGLRTGEHFSC